MRKPAFGKCENKDADQLHDHREADKHLCFRYAIIQYLYSVQPKLAASSHIQLLYSPVLSDLVGNSEDRFFVTQLK